MRLEDIPPGIWKQMLDAARSELPGIRTLHTEDNAVIFAAVKVLLKWLEANSSYELEPENPYSNPWNWRANFCDGSAPTPLEHGNVITIEGTGQVLLEYIGPNVKQIYRELSEKYSIGFCHETPDGRCVPLTIALYSTREKAEESLTKFKQTLRGHVEQEMLPEYKIFRESTLRVTREEVE